MAIRNYFESTHISRTFQLETLALVENFAHIFCEKIIMAACVCNVTQAKYAFYKF